MPTVTVDQSTAAKRVYHTFARWKRHRVPDDTALYHTLLDIRYRRGGFPERFALFRLRWAVRLHRAKLRRATQSLLRR